MTAPAAATVPGASASGALVSLDSATLSYDGRTPAATGLTFEVDPGDALALIGPNGAGKSTILKGLLGLVHVIEGRLEVLGTTPRRASMHVGYMPQHDEIDPEFPVTLRQVVMMGRYRQLGPVRWPGAADRAAVDAVLERVGLADRARTRFGDLSGGQQQRGLLARALVSDPDLLLLDEPFNGLDTTNRLALMATLRELRAHGHGIVVCTHDLELATQVCSHALLMNHHMVAFGTVDEVLTPEHVTEAFGEDEHHLDTHHDHLAHPHPVRTAATETIPERPER